MNNNENTSDFFNQTITAAFTVASFQVPKDLRYEPPREDETLPAFLRKPDGRRKAKDPWAQGWHNGFPPGAGA